MSDRKTAKPRLGLPVWAHLLLIALPLAAGLISLLIGRYSVSPSDVAGAFGRLTSGAGMTRTDRVLLNMRLPRVALSLLCGAGLSVSGCAFQALFVNPLATPDTLGVASGASFGAALAILLGLPLIGIQGFALVSGLAALALTALCAAGRDPFGGGRSGASSMILAGIMMQSLFTALVSLVKFTADTENQLPAITYWLMGSLASASWKTLAFGAPPIIAGAAALCLLSWRLNLLMLSEEEARSSGVDVKRLKLVTAFCAAMITASCVSMCGQVGWVGLLAPHMCRLLTGGSMKRLVPASLGAGAAFMAVVDTAARSATASEIPVSILTAVIGAPLFIVLMRRNRLFP